MFCYKWNECLNDCCTELGYGNRQGQCAPSREIDDELRRLFGWIAWIKHGVLVDMKKFRSRFVLGRCTLEQGKCLQKKGSTSWKKVLALFPIPY